MSKGMRELFKDFDAKVEPIASVLAPQLENCNASTADELWDWCQEHHYDIGVDLMTGDWVVIDSENNVLSRAA